MTPGLPWIWHEAYAADIGPHVFPTSKYDRVREVLLADGTVREEDLREPAAASWDDLGRVHTREYLRKVRDRDFSRSEIFRLELPLTEEFRRASLLCAGGTTLAGRAAVDRGVCLHLGGGFHHAFADHGEGFCLLNDVAVAVRGLRAEGVIDRAAVVDCDVHQGNGTAAIFADDDDVFTFSMHQAANYPLEKPPSDLDVGLEDGIDDDAYLGILAERLPAVLDTAPDLVVYLAGADPYREDQLGGLGLTKRGLRRRDELVLEACRERGVGVSACLAGGYAVRLDDTVAIHAATGRACAASWRELRAASG